ncbi:DUF4199 family protein [Flammeovirga kamogawensis]|uniref:DUF4199 family protein n=1 Tax=Flammeovirga kamogawensis TaxID=373891 RepID=A0ABX8GSR6_9BACT|nr:DUF4199 family protein [Flammeovirga kamogawensis]MBB6462920.1 hypothetical protein [Flammeovirga kamogawensis]QWG06449.1 DUF4199 family protein [Flammeovirga kamogawensis]TRX68279.1 DUF4199 domain-containing protein [Flammeovirga kamogawensis]
MTNQTNNQPLKFLRPDLFKVGAIAGVMAAFVCAAYILLLHQIGENSFGRWKNVYFPLYGFFFAGAMSYFRLKLNNGRMQAPQGILIGITLNTVGSATYGFLLYIILSTKELGKAIITRHAADLKILMLEGKEIFIEQLGETEFNKQVAELDNLTPSILAIDQAIGMLFLGIFLTFLFMLIIKKK